MKSIVLIVPYFGKWPVWFDAYLISVAANPTVYWLCPTDCEIPSAHPNNIKFLPITLSELNKHVDAIVSAKVPLNPRKFCDLKPAYAEIFAAEVQEYDFWGICDMDIIWGDIRNFITEDILADYVIISSRKENISGHFTLFRNSEKVNSLYKSLPNYKALFEVPQFNWMDEVVLSKFIKNDPDFKKSGLKVYWPKILCNQENGRDSHQEYYLDRWLWKDGKMLNTKTGVEVMYLHFINWKRTMKYCEVKYNDSPQQFYISFDSIHYKKHSAVHIHLRNITNVFNGYYAILKRRAVKKKIESLKKRLKRVFIK